MRDRDSPVGRVADLPETESSCHRPFSNERKPPVKTRLETLGAYLLFGFGLNLLLASILIVPQNAFADSGCSCPCGFNCDASLGGDPGSQKCKDCLDFCCNGDNSCEANCYLYYAPTGATVVCNGCTTTCRPCSGFFECLLGPCAGSCTGTAVTCPTGCGCGPSSQASTVCGCWNEFGYGT